MVIYIFIFDDTYNDVILYWISNSGTILITTYLLDEFSDEIELTCLRILSHVMMVIVCVRACVCVLNERKYYNKIKLHLLLNQLEGN